MTLSNNETTENQEDCVGSFKNLYINIPVEQDAKQMVAEHSKLQKSEAIAIHHNFKKHNFGMCL